ncbi:MAG TPA: cytochrome b/b6 domain-containing protein [Hyphomicrobium sp.]|nr:cytochrome b/b6 domain-containing protein [Hyphomicrobium sp.]
MADDERYDIPIYSRQARRFHWWVASFILLQVPIGLYMTYRGYEMETVNDKGEIVKGVWDGITNTLYNSHKTLGLLILLLVVLRLSYRLVYGAPPPDRSVPSAMIGASHAVHWGIYLALLVTPIIGYVGISYGRYLEVFGIPLPPVTIEDKKFAEEVFEYHETAAIILLCLIGVHVAAAVYHKFIRQDRVVERMLPNKKNIA